jgi:hypothetical protein
LNHIQLAIIGYTRWLRVSVGWQVEGGGWWGQGTEKLGTQKC